MKITGENGIGKMLELLLQICFYIGIVVLIILPFILNKVGLSLRVSMYIIYPNGIVFLMIMHKFIKLFNSLRLNNPFCDENVKLLRKTGIISFIGSVLWGADFLYEMIINNSNDIILYCELSFLSILFFGVSIALYILSELFKQATEFKKENDLTI